MEVADIIFILAVWIFVLARITVEKESDSPDTKTIKRIARSTLTATLIVAVVLAGLALVVVYNAPPTE